MAISEMLNTRSEAILKGILNVANEAQKTYTALEKEYDLKVQMRVYSSGEAVSYMRMAEVRSIRDHVKALQEVESDAIDAFTRYASDLSMHRAYNNERDFSDTLEKAKSEYDKLDGDLKLYIH